MMSVTIFILFVSATVKLALTLSSSSALTVPNLELSFLSPNRSCPAWIMKEAINSDVLCYPLYHLLCDENHISVLYGLCITYSEDDDILSMFHCPFFHASDYNVTTDGYLLLPNDIYQLNDNMCGPLNRKGTLCSECVEGYGPAVNSFKDDCSNCKGVWYGVPLYLITELLPITLFYLIILIFQINVTSAPMTCFIMYSQMILTIFDIKFDDPVNKKLLYTDRFYPSTFMKIVFTSYGIWNLDFFKYVIPPFCVSSNLKVIHIALLGYVSAFYPLCLVIATWICIELHDRNFKPFVLVWKPFGVCLVQLRKTWNNKGDIISVFASFFLLAYSKFLYQGLVLTMCKNMSKTKYHAHNVVRDNVYLSYSDPRVLCRSTEYLTFAIPAIVIFFLFNVVPVVLIFVYPIPKFRKLLWKCGLDCNTLRCFVERFQGCYKDVTHGENQKDMRSFSALYFFLRIMALIAVLFLRIFDDASYQMVWFPIGIVVLIAAILIAFCKPYKKALMNVVDTLLLMHFSLLCFLMSVGCTFNKVYIWPIIKLLFLVPFAVFILWLVLSTVFKTKTFLLTTLMYFKQKRDREIVHTRRHVQNVEQSYSSDSEFSQPLINPTSTTIIDITSYGST